VRETWTLSCHSGHFNQSETPEAREALRVEMEEKEEARAKKAMKALEEMEGKRKKSVLHSHVAAYGLRRAGGKDDCPI
jgi:hypothetical protein